MTTHNMEIREGFWWLCALVTSITMALPYVAFGGSPPSITEQRSFSRPFSGLFVGDDEPVEIIIQQSLPAPITEPAKPAKKGTYVQPQWVDGGYGVQVLEPGHWIDPQKQAGQ